MTGISKLLLPNTWVRVTLADVYTMYGGGTPSTAKAAYWSGEIPWITSADIEGVKRINVRRRVSDLGIVHSAANKVPAGALLVATRVGLGKVAIADEPICFSQDIQALVQSPDLVCPAYTLYLLSFTLQALKFEGRGTTISGLTKRQLAEIPFPLPPHNEQRRIVAKLEELLSELDAGVDSLNTAREQLKVYRQALLKHAFEGKLTAEWRQLRQSDEAHWREVTLGELLSFVTSGSRGWARYYAEHGALFVRAQNLKHDRLDLEEAAFVSLPVQAEGTRTKLEIGDLLVTITGANVTKTGLVTTDLGTAYVSQHVALCRPRASVLPAFLYWFLVSEAAGRKQLNAFAYGAGKPGLNLANIRSVTIFLPDLDEQLEIVREIELALSVEERLCASIAAELSRSEALRQSILKRAFSGQLVPQDRGDEPASVLLERIRAETGGVGSGTPVRMPRRGRKHAKR